MPDIKEKKEGLCTLPKPQFNRILQVAQAPDRRKFVIHRDPWCNYGRYAHASNFLGVSWCTASIHVPVHVHQEWRDKQTPESHGHCPSPMICLCNEKDHTVTFFKIASSYFFISTQWSVHKGTFSMHNLEQTLSTRKPKMVTYTTLDCECLVCISCC